MTNNLNEGIPFSEELISSPTDELVKYIIANASPSARERFDLELGGLYSKNADKAAERLKYMLARRFIVAGQKRQSEAQTPLKLSHYFPDINGMVFSAKCNSVKNPMTTEFILFKNTSVKLCEQECVKNSDESACLVERWLQNNISGISDAEQQKALRRDELQQMLNEVKVGCVFAVYMVNEGKTPVSVGPPQDFYQVTDIASQHSVGVRLLATRFASNDITSRTFVPDSFESDVSIKRLAMAGFIEGDGKRYNYLRFSTGGGNKHGYLLDCKGQEHSVHRTASELQD